MPTQITGLTTYPSQNLTIPHPAGDGLIKMKIYYKPRLSAWFMDIDSDKLKIKGFRIFLSPNILVQYRRNSGFGMAVVSNDGIEPLLLNDFSSGRIEIYILDESDAEYYNNVIEGRE